MKHCILCLFAILAIASCKKDDLTKNETYSNVVYTIHSGDSNLQVNLMRAVYEGTVKGNIGKDTVLANPGDYTIEATVFTGIPVTLFAYSEKGPDFHLKIESETGKTLAETGTITVYPPNQLHPTQWVSKITADLTKK